MKYILVLVMALLISPVLIKLYLEFMPGEMVGSVDGWLGFLGGYTGGLLAFISAIFVMNKQRSETIKPFLDLKTSPNRVDSILYDIPSPDKKYIDLNTFKTRELGRDDTFLTIKARNIGLGPCLKLKVLNKRKVDLNHYYTNDLGFLNNYSLATIEQGKDVMFALALDLHSKDHQGRFIAEFYVTYQDINGKKYEQPLIIRKISNEKFEVMVN